MQTIHLNRSVPQPHQQSHEPPDVMARRVALLRRRFALSAAVANIIAELAFARRAAR